MTAHPLPGLPAHQRPAGVHPPLDFPGYRSAARRHPHQPLVHAVASGRREGDGEAGGDRKAVEEADSGAIGDDDNAASRPSGGRAAG